MARGQGRENWSELEVVALVEAANVSATYAEVLGNMRALYPEGPVQRSPGSIRNRLEVVMSAMRLIGSTALHPSKDPLLDIRSQEHKEETLKAERGKPVTMVADIPVAPTTPISYKSGAQIETERRVTPLFKKLFDAEVARTNGNPEASALWPQAKRCGYTTDQFFKMWQDIKSEVDMLAMCES